MTLLKVPGTKFVRDTQSNAIINHDLSGLQEYEAKRRMAANQRNEINNIKQEMNDIKSDVSDIKNLLSQLLDKING